MVRLTKNMDKTRLTGYDDEKKSSFIKKKDRAKTDKKKGSDPGFVLP